MLIFLVSNYMLYSSVYENEHMQYYSRTAQANWAFELEMYKLIH